MFIYSYIVPTHCCIDHPLLPACPGQERAPSPYRTCKIYVLETVKSKEKCQKQSGKGKG